MLIANVPPALAHIIPIQILIDPRGLGSFDDDVAPYLAQGYRIFCIDALRGRYEARLIQTTVIH